jgi:hypothetical protein
LNILSQGTSPRQRGLQAAAVLVFLTVLAYWPGLHGGFLWDDDTLILDNPLVRSANGLYSIWFSTKSIDYWPLTYTSFWVEWRLFGTSPLGYHIVSLCLHLASAFLIWNILRRLDIRGAYLAALLFAVHPVNVESVLWISQRKNTLSEVFLLLSILWYIQDRYVPSLLGFCLAMLAKGSVATLPALLLLVVCWQHRRVTARDLWRMVPFGAVAGVLTIVNVWFQTHGSGEVIRHVTWTERVLGAMGALWFYLWKALVPVHLAFVYPQWNVDAHRWVWWMPLLGTIAVTVILLVRRHRPGYRATFFAWSFFVLALLPVLGLTDVYFMRYSLVADRYQYVGLIAVIAFVAAAIDVGADRLAGAWWGGTGEDVADPVTK